ncbi:hypothetical protein AGMMS49983_22200 [Clostridia bacterium]|nr:hypothetical protein AGMMS49983_22200 [Clostridia bacterium]
MKESMTYKEAELLYGSQYRVSEAVGRGELYRIARGLYSRVPFANPFLIIAMRYPHAIVTADTAYYLHGLTDVIPEKTYLATKRNATRIRDPSIVQVFVTGKLFEPGRSSLEVDGVLISIYDKERMLIETLRKSGAMPFDYYKEIIASYRKIIDDLDFRKIEEYAGLYKRNEHLYEAFQREVL